MGSQCQAMDDLITDSIKVLSWYSELRSVYLYQDPLEGRKSCLYFFGLVLASCLCSKAHSLALSPLRSGMICFSSPFKSLYLFSEVLCKREHLVYNILETAQKFVPELFLW